MKHQLDAEYDTALVEFAVLSPLAQLADAFRLASAKAASVVESMWWSLAQAATDPIGNCLTGNPKSQNDGESLQ